MRIQQSQWIFVCLSIWVPSVGAQDTKETNPKADPPEVTAKAWCLLDAKTGKMLAGKQEQGVRPIASTSKIMTAWIVVELALQDEKVLQEEITFSERADKTPGSSSKLLQGDRIAVKDLLYGLLLPSGNDAAVALAEHFGSRLQPNAEKTEDSTQLFVNEMNLRVKKLQLQKMQYQDPHGLSSKNESSAFELATFAWHASQNRLLREYVRTKEYRCKVKGSDGQMREVVWTNTNQLLKLPEYDGIKTGTTTPAGACLVSTGKSADCHLLLAILGSKVSEDRYTDSKAIYAWGWQKFAPAVPKK